MGFLHPGKNAYFLTAGLRLRDRPYSPRSRPRPRPRLLRSRSGTQPPPPPTTPLSRLESLPPEILHNIFTHAPNPSLPLTSAALAQALSSRHLQLSYVRQQSSPPDALTAAFKLRFFKAPFLAAWEGLYGRLDCTGTELPARALSDVTLGRLLLERGANLGDTDGMLHAALVGRRREAVEMMLDAGVKADSGCLRIAVAAGDLDVCVRLVEAGADAADVGVWREALALEGGGRGVAVRWLLERAAPPGEVLGELSRE